MRSLLPIVALAWCQPLFAQSNEAHDARIMPIAATGDAGVSLNVMPGTGLMVLLLPGERVQRITSNKGTAFDVRVPSDQDGLHIVPREADARATLSIETDRRNLVLNLATGTGRNTALVARFLVPEPEVEAVLASKPGDGPRWSYRLRGDREVRPARLYDDATRTFVEFGPGQALPAVFAIGPTGDEEVVNGYMRQGIYVIDRVYAELVFRIDKDRATARRNSEPDDGDE